MKPDSINPDARSLEEAFFARQNAKLLENLRAKTREAERRAALREVVLIEDDALLDHLIRLGIGPETVLALWLVPLVFVAWADGKLDANERKAILDAAEQRGVAAESPGRQLLDTWLSQAPEPALLETWKRYVASIWGSFDANERREMRERLLGWSRAVAAAAGGFLGLTSRISASEQAVLDQLDAALPG